MKSQINTVFFLLITTVLLLLTSCREESDDNIFPSEEEALLANTELSNLILKSTTNNGATDNILDGSSCYSISLPVTVVIEKLKIIVASPADFDQIEDVFENLEEDIEDLTFIYPITLIDSNFTEIIVKNEDQFDELLDRCEDSIDDDIECVEFNYPLSVSAFNRVSETIESITFEDDKSLHKFIKNLTVNDIVEFDFPITITQNAQNKIETESLDALRTVLRTSSSDDCKDKEDTDEDRFIEQLTSSEFTIQKFKEDNNNLTKNYRKYVFEFSEDGAVIAKSDKEEISGTWSYSDRTLNIQFVNSDLLEQLNKSWKVKKVLENRIICKNSGAGKDKDDLFLKKV